jgi:integrase
VSLSRGEITLRAENTKDREDRTIPISSRFRQMLEMRRNDPEGSPFPPSGYVFGDEVGHRLGSIKRAWQTSVLRAHGHEHMLGHASLQQTSTYLNATLLGLHKSMRTLEQSRAACKSVASKPTCSPRPTRKQDPASDGNSLIH